MLYCIKLLVVISFGAIELSVAEDGLSDTTGFGENPKPYIHVDDLTTLTPLYTPEPTQTRESSSAITAKIAIAEHTEEPKGTEPQQSPESIEYNPVLPMLISQAIEVKKKLETISRPSQTSPAQTISPLPPQESSPVHCRQFSNVTSEEKDHIGSKINAFCSKELHLIDKQSISNQYDLKSKFRLEARLTDPSPRCGENDAKDAQKNGVVIKQVNKTTSLLSYSP